MEQWSENDKLNENRMMKCWYGNGLLKLYRHQAQQRWQQWERYWNRYLILWSILISHASIASWHLRAAEIFIWKCFDSFSLFYFNHLEVHNVFGSDTYRIAFGWQPNFRHNLRYRSVAATIAFPEPSVKCAVDLQFTIVFRFDRQGCGCGYNWNVRTPLAIFSHASGPAIWFSA